jgi:hypothetical protein
MGGGVYRAGAICAKNRSVKTKLKRLLSKAVDHGCHCDDPRCSCERVVFLSFFTVCRRCREGRHERVTQKKKKQE